MSHPVLWSLDPHTAAKHRVLRSYVEAWIPVMAQQALSVAHVERPRLLLIDGFAGRASGVTCPRSITGFVLESSGYRQNP